MTEDQRTTQEIERDLARNRSTIDEAVSRLQERFSPGQLMDDVLSAVRDRGGAEFGRNLGDTIRTHPVPVLMTAAGLTWLALGSRNGGGHRQADPPGPGLGQRASTAMGNAAGTISGGTQSLTEHARHAAAAAGDTARQAAQSVEEAAREVAETGRQVAEGAGAQISHLAQQSGALLHRYPLAAGLISVGVGAVLASLMPVTDTERQRFGPYRERVKGQIKGTAAEFAERAKSVGQAMAEEAKRGSQEEGLAGHQADSAKGLGEAAKRTLERTMEAGKRETERHVAKAGERSPEPQS